MPEKTTSQEVKSTETMYIGDKEFTVNSIFIGTETASKLIYNMAVKRILNEAELPMKNDG